MPKRLGKVWSSSLGWISKRATEAVDYKHFTSEGWAFFISFVRIFPDFLLDIFRSENADYGDEELIQRVIMRTKAQYQYVDVTGCRGMTKTSTTFKEEMVELIVWPGTRLSYYGPSYKQMAKVGGLTYHQIEKDYPGLVKHFILVAEGADRLEFNTPYHSNFAITGMRGDNIHKVVAEEYAQENTPVFDFEEYKRVVLPAVRLQHMVSGKADPKYVRFRQHTITSAGRRQNHSYETRMLHYQMMERGESAFVMDVPFSVPLLSLMRPVAWAEGLRSQLSPEEWSREMESYYTGSDQNPIVRDEVLTEARSMLRMEEHHCCKDADNRMLPQDVIYVVGYDVSYEDDKRNARCACVVVKLTKQKEWLKRDKYLKQVVWVDDWSPKNAMEQARRLKQVWYRFCFDGSETYIAIDSWQYGKAVVQALMMDLGDGLNPLCIYRHASETEVELENAVPVIYPVKAGGVGVTDNDADMVRYMEVQFENRNIELLTSNYAAGIESYKKVHRIKDDRNDAMIYRPYKKTNELVGQIQNLKKVPSGSGIAERRISKHIQRDSWSALKYACRMAAILERSYLVKVQKKSLWEEEFKKYGKNAMKVGASEPMKMRFSGRVGGRRY